MDEIIEQVESLIAMANIGVIVTMNGTDHHLINQLTSIKEALTKQKWQQHGIMRPESESAQWGELLPKSVDAVAEAVDFSCWISLGGGEQCKQVCDECSMKQRGSPLRGNRD